MLYREVSNMEKAKEEVSKMHECPNYNDCAFPVNMIFSRMEEVFMMFTGMMKYNSHM